MDNFREWLSDNLRYILLGLGIILVLVAAVFAVKLVGKLTDDSVPQETQSESGTADSETESEPKEETKTEKANSLVENDQKILETIQAYYTARSNKDIDALTALVENLSEEDKQAILNNTVIESYNNITTHSKNGPVENSYVVYTYYEAKVAGIETLAPGLGCLYLCTREDSSLYIADKEKDSSVAEYIANMNADEDVKELAKAVDEKYYQVLESDKALKNMLADEAAPQTEVVLPDSNEVDIQANKIVKAAELCNVRADSREDSEVIGMLEAGDVVTRVQKLDNGWSEIRYMDTIGYVRSDLLTEESTDSSEATPES